MAVQFLEVEHFSVAAIDSFFPILQHEKASDFEQFSRVEVTGHLQHFAEEASVVKEGSPV